MTCHDLGFDVQEPGKPLIPWGIYPKGSGSHGGSGKAGKGWRWDNMYYYQEI